MAKFFKVFRAGIYPQGNVSEQDVQEMASTYDPKFHEAPLTVNHQDDSAAYAIVDEVKAIGKELFVSFRDIIAEAYEMNKKFRKPSIEIARYNDKAYLRAVTMCNFPQVKNLDTLAFSEEKKQSIYFTENLSFNLNKGDAMFPEHITKLAEKLSINISDYSVEGDLVTDAINAVTDLQTKLAEKTTEISSLNVSLGKFSEGGITPEKFAELNTEITSVKTENEALKTERIEMLGEFAVNVKDCIPAQVENIKNIAKVNFAEAKKFVAALPAKKINRDLPRFASAEKNVTYEEVLKNPELAKNFSEDELNTLKKNSKTF
ncbi:MAG: hypothetical protein H3C35_08525 [Bacteroidetes bacterium]|nr:hypothetical protein [Bacteroidota bacterium]